MHIYFLRKETLCFRSLNVFVFICITKKNSITSKMHVIYGIFLNLKVWQVIFIPVARILDFFFYTSYKDVGHKITSCSISFFVRLHVCVYVCWRVKWMVVFNHEYVCLIPKYKLKEIQCLIQCWELCLVQLFKKMWTMLQCVSFFDT